MLISDCVIYNMKVRSILHRKRNIIPLIFDVRDTSGVQLCLCIESNVPCDIHNTRRNQQTSRTIWQDSVQYSAVIIKTNLSHENSLVENVRLQRFRSTIKIAISRIYYLDDSNCAIIYKFVYIIELRFNCNLSFTGGHKINMHQTQYSLTINLLIIINIIVFGRRFIKFRW